jgi:hypothetical protein
MTGNTLKKWHVKLPAAPVGKTGHAFYANKWGSHSARKVWQGNSITAINTAICIPKNSITLKVQTGQITFWGNKQDVTERVRSRAALKERVPPSQPV